MRAILINPATEIVSALEFEGDYKDVQRILDCRCFTTVRIDGPNQESIFIDDEGLLQEVGYVFEFNGHPLVGKGLILGCDDEGETIGTDMSLAVILSQINWVGTCTFDV